MTFTRLLLATWVLVMAVAVGVAADAPLATAPTVAPAAPAAAPAVQVLLPYDYRVFQRNAQNQAQVPVKVKAVGASATARLVLLPNYKGQDVDWTALTAAAEGTFSGALTAQAGGWYKLEVKVTDAAGAVTTGEVAHVGVGEVFITAGQSNAGAYGNPKQKATDDRVVHFIPWEVTGYWAPAEDPRCAGFGNGGSPWPHLGDMLARTLQMPIAFGGNGIGGSGTADWIPENPKGSIRWLAGSLKNLEPNGVRLVLWHQGETDAATKVGAEEYARRLTAMMQYLDKEIGWHLPWMVAQASFAQATPEADRAAVRAGQRLLWERGLALQGPLTDDLIGPVYRSPDLIHFNQLGLTTHAERWYAMLWAQVYAEPPLRAEVVSGK